MDLVAGLREWKNAEIGEDKGKLITYMSSLEINDIYSLIKKKILYVKDWTVSPKHL